MSVCKSCQRPIRWVPSAATGNLMCLDAEPVEDGNVIVEHGKAVVLRGDLFEQLLEGPRYVSHFATCPNAAQHRKAKP